MVSPQPGFQLWQAVTGLDIHEESCHKDEDQDLIKAYPDLIRSQKKQQRAVEEMWTSWRDSKDLMKKKEMKWKYIEIHLTGKWKCHQEALFWIDWLEAQ